MSIQVLPSSAAHGPAIGGAALRRALIAGSQRVIAARDELNRINVFPVPDGDTGTNLAFTFGAVLQGLRRLRRATVAQVLRQAADDALDGARGNSGAIVAQFFQGLAAELQGQVRVSTQVLVRAFQRAAVSARLALAEPREGTILSVITAFAVGLRQSLAQGWSGLRAVFQAGLQAARDALAHTPRQLKVLAQAGVVDAGGQGFVDFLEGMDDFLQRGRQALAAGAVEAVAEPLLDLHGAHGEEDPPFRYCTECLLQGEDLDLDVLRLQFSQLPLDSLVLAGHAQRMRIHAHVDQPALLFEAAARLGEVSARKADDMRAQTRSRGLKQSLVVVCDSAADLPEDAADRLHIHVVPVRVHIGEEEYLDRITLAHGALYQRLRAGDPQIRTSQPPSGEFRRLFEMLRSQGRQVLCLNISGALSGTWQAADAATRGDDAAQVVAWDTRHAATGEGLLVLRAAEAAAAGWTLPQVVGLLEAERESVQTWALIADLQYGVRGGRLPRFLLPLSRWLRFTVAIRRRPDGRIGPWKLLFGRKRRVERFVDRVLAQLAHGQRYRLMVGHCDDLPAAEQAVARLRGDARVAQVDLVQTGTAIGVHAGPGTVVIGSLPVRPLPGADP